MLKAILLEIDRLLMDKYRDEYESLNPGASDSDIELLKQRWYPKDTIPDELETLFRWHNGQTLYHSINQDDNRRLLSIEEALDSADFLSNPNEDILQPWSRSWLPVLSNGSGDYLVYETMGDDRGKLVSYWHDDPDRSIEYESLELWANTALNASQI